jgi:hypothetical protein
MRTALELREAPPAEQAVRDAVVAALPEEPDVRRALERKAPPQRLTLEQLLAGISAQRSG